MFSFGAAVAGCVCYCDTESSPRVSWWDLVQCVEEKGGLQSLGLDFASLKITSSKYSAVVRMGTSLCFPAGHVSTALKISHSIAMINCPL